MENVRTNSTFRFQNIILHCLMSFGIPCSFHFFQGTREFLKLEEDGSQPAASSWAAGTPPPPRTSERQVFPTRDKVIEQYFGE